MLFRTPNAMEILLVSVELIQWVPAAGAWPGSCAVACPGSPCGRNHVSHWFHRRTGEAL